MSALAGQRVAVVGGAGGIGVACVVAIARAGAAVLVVDRDPAAAEAVARPLGGAALALDLDEPEAAVAALDAAGPPLHGLVNAAGVAEAAPGLFGAAAWERLLRVNLVAPVLLAEAAAGRMARGGAIVNVTSIAGRTVLATSGAPTPAYAASKAALEHATRALAVAAGPRGVRVNAVAPGFARTPMTAAALARDGGWIARRTPLGQLVAPEEVADAVVFLLGAGAAGVTGATLVVDGGVSLGLINPGGGR